MIQFLVTAVIVVIALFILALLLCLMVWVVTKLLRFLFPQRFNVSKTKKDKKDKKKPVNHVTGQAVEDRCDKCSSYGTCPMPFLVPAPCLRYAEKTEPGE